MTSGYCWDSSKSSAVCLRAEADTRAPGDGAAGPCASFNRDGDGLFDRLRAAVSFVGEVSVGLQHQFQRFLEISLGLRQCLALGVDAWNFFDIAEVPFASLQIDGGKLTNHSRLLVIDPRLCRAID